MVSFHLEMMIQSSSTSGWDSPDQPRPFRTMSWASFHCIFNISWCLCVQMRTEQQSHSVKFVPLDWLLVTEKLARRDWNLYLRSILYPWVLEIEKTNTVHRRWNPQYLDRAQDWTITSLPTQPTGLIEAIFMLFVSLQGS